jgi:hypothetical protein
VFALAFAAYAFLAVVMTHPLATHLTTQVPHDLGDPLLSATLLWWNSHTLPLTERWWNGFFFAPASGVLAFSDHRLGESLIATPLQWLGLSPLTAYNVTLLLTFPLSAIAAHALAYVLTRRHDAALVAGLGYGFNPYRFAHIEHLELLAAYGMPAALAALHLYLQDRRARWLALFAAALLLQALSCSYYFLFFLTMLGLWGLWFTRTHELALVARAAGAVAAVLAVLAPLAWSYRSIHGRYGFARGLNDIVTLSADVTSYLTASPLLSVWGWTSTLTGPERQLMPGATLVVLVVAGIAASVRTAEVRRGRRVMALFAWFAAGFAAIAAVEALAGPWRAAAGPVTISVGTTFKPLSLAVACLLIAVAASPLSVEAFRARSAFAFYLVAAGFLLLCSLGPKPAFLGHQVLYEPPYAWLMRIAVFGESIRVPARFAMPAILALSAAAAIAYARLSTGRRGPVLLGTLCAAIALEGWTRDLPMFAPPSPPPPSVTAAGAASLLELPLGDTSRDVAAMYRAMLAGIPTVNGYSGFMPPHYEALRIALDERDDAAIDALAAGGPLAVAVDARADRDGRQRDWIAGQPGVSPLGSGDGLSWFLVGRRGRAVDKAAVCDGEPLPLGGAFDARGAVDMAALGDRSAATRWTSGDGQRAGQELWIDLGRVAHPCAVRLSLGDQVGAYPRALSVWTSSDGVAWTKAAERRTAGLAIAAALERPRDPRMAIALDGAAARYLRLRLESDCASVPWIVTGLVVSDRPAG